MTSCWMVENCFTKSFCASLPFSITFLKASTGSVGSLELIYHKITCVIYLTVPVSSKYNQTFNRKQDSLHLQIWSMKSLDGTGCKCAKISDFHSSETNEKVQ